MIFIKRVKKIYTVVLFAAIIVCFDVRVSFGADAKSSSVKIEQSSLDAYNDSTNITGTTKEDERKNSQIDKLATQYEDAKKGNIAKEKKSVAEKNINETVEIKDLVQTKNSINGTSVNREITRKPFQPNSPIEIDPEQNGDKKDVKISIQTVDEESLNAAQLELKARVEKSRRKILTNEQIDAMGLPFPNSNKMYDKKTQMPPYNIAKRYYNKENRHLVPVEFEFDFIQEAFNLIGSKNFTKEKFYAIVGKLTQPHVLDEYGNTLLMHAIFHKKEPVIIYLIKTGMDLNKRNAFGVSPLHLAAYTKSHTAIVALLEAGANVNVVDLYGNTPVMYSAMSGDLYGVSRLIEFDADLDMINVNKLEIMDFAYSSRNLALINLLIRHDKTLMRRKDKEKIGVIEEGDLLDTDVGRSLIIEYEENIVRSHYFYYAN